MSLIPTVLIVELFLKKYNIRVIKTFALKFLNFLLKYYSEKYLCETDFFLTKFAKFFIKTNKFYTEKHQIYRFFVFMYSFFINCCFFKVILPKVREEKLAAMEAKCALGSSNFSDHLVLLKAYDGWIKARRNQYDKQYCSQNFLSYSCLSMIDGIK